MNRRARIVGWHQFWPGEKPWPPGVEHVAHDRNRDCFVHTASDGTRRKIKPGGLVVFFAGGASAAYHIESVSAPTDAAEAEASLVLPP